ncbi:MAG: NTP transferase domain-containing protein [Planctomycetes bacterium]|nr:NTP transferase domain-containing protein [Planctomycetota bacterium]
MINTLGIVELHDQQHRNTLVRRLGGKPLIEWVVRRANDSQLLDGVIVAAGDTPADREMAALVPSDVPVFYGSKTDVLRRFRDAALQFGAEHVVRISADNPFIDPALIDRLVTVAALELQDTTPLDYVGYSSRDGRPEVESPLGVFAEWMTTRALRRAERRASDPRDRQSVTRHMYSHLDEFRVLLIPVPTQLDRDDVRLTIDSHEDWEHAQEILEALGPERLDWQGIAGLLHHQPGMRERMAVLNREAART